MEGASKVALRKALQAEEEAHKAKERRSCLDDEKVMEARKQCLGTGR